MFGVAQSLRKYRVTRFNGSNQRIDLGNVYGFARTDSWSVSVWVRTNSTGALVAKQLSSGAFTGWGLATAGSGASAVVRWALFGTTAGSAYLDTRFSVPHLDDGKWHHLLCTYNGTSIASGCAVYYDGAAASVSSTPRDDLSGSIATAAPLQLGARNSADSFLAGDMQDVCIFAGTVLTLADAQALYNRGVPPNVLALSLTASPSSYWLLGEHKGDTVLDAGRQDAPTWGDIPDLGSSNFDGQRVNVPLTITRNGTRTLAPEKLDTSTSPVALYLFESNKNDSSGNGYNLTNAAGSDNYDSHHGITAFRFTGSQRLTNTATPAAFRIHGDLSVDALFCPHARGAGNVIVTCDDPSSASAPNHCLYQVTYTDTDISFFMQNGSNQTYAFSTVLGVGRFHHLCWTKSVSGGTATVKLYIDGVHVATSTLPNPTDGSATNLHVGGAAFSPPNFYLKNCSLASLRISPSVLTATKVAQEYNRCLGSLYGTVPVP